MSRPAPTWSARGAVAILAVLLAVTGCSTTDKEKPLQTRSKDEASNQVEVYFRDLSVLVTGKPDAEHEKIGLGPAHCQGKQGETASDGRFYMQGTYLLRVPGAGVRKAALDKILGDWQAKGYEITEALHQLKDGTWKMTGRNPADGFQIVADEPPNENLGFLIFSTCYIPPSP